MWQTALEAAVVCFSENFFILSVRVGIRAEGILCRTTEESKQEVEPHAQREKQASHD